MLFGLMRMPRPVVPDLQPIEISEGAPDVSFFGRGNPDLCRNEYWLRYEPFRAWNTLTCRQPVTGNEDGCGCMVGARRSSGSLALFLTMLGVIPASQVQKLL